MELPKISVGIINYTVKRPLYNHKSSEIFTYHQEFNNRMAGSRIRQVVQFQLVSIEIILDNSHNIPVVVAKEQTKEI